MKLASILAAVLVTLAAGTADAATLRITAPGHVTAGRHYHVVVRATGELGDGLRTAITHGQPCAAAAAAPAEFQWFAVRADVVNDPKLSFRIGYDITAGSAGRRRFCGYLLRPPAMVPVATAEATTSVTPRLRRH